MDLEPEEKKYAIWYEKQYPGFAKRLKEKTTHFALHPKFSIIVPLYHTPLDFFDDMMEQAITIKKLDGYDQLYSMADSEIRRVIDTNEDIELAMQNLNDELNILLEKQ